MNTVEKIAKLTDEQIREMARLSGRAYLDVIKDLEAMKKQASYWKTPAAKAAAKRYREKRAARINELKGLL